MSASFCVLNEKWIPVIDLDGTQREVSLRVLLQEAHNLREISDASPLVEYGLYRLVIVFLADALRPQNEEEWKALLKEKHFPMEKIEAYIQLCETEGVRFDLFDEQRPFLQAPFRAEWDKVRKPVSTLDYTIPNGNNHTHFDHRNNKEIQLSYAQAARLLPAVQLFCPLGGRGYSYGINGSPPYYTIINGKNLFETLVYSTIYVGRTRMNFDRQPVIWRNTMEIEPKKELGAVSWLFGMIFPARRILLIPQEHSKTIAEIYWKPGLIFKGADSWRDSYVSYCDGAKGRAPLLPKPKENKAVWRNLYDLVQEKHRPEILSQYKDITDELYAHITMYGVETEKANFYRALRHDMDIPTALIDDEAYTVALKKAIDMAEKLEKALENSLKLEDVSEKELRTQRKYKRNVPLIPKGSKPLHKNIPPEVSQRAVQAFYDDCERYVKILCNRLINGEDETIVSQDWREEICQSANNQWNIAWKSLSLRGKAIAKVIDQRVVLLKCISWVRKGVHGVE